MWSPNRLGRAYDIDRDTLIALDGETTGNVLKTLIKHRLAGLDMIASLKLCHGKEVEVLEMLLGSQTFSSWAAF